MPASEARLTLTPRAREDLRQALLSSRQRWGVEQRRRYRRRLVAAMADLVAFPALGRSRDDLVSGCRALRVEQHVIFYRLSGNEIIIGRVLHVRQEAIGQVEF